MKVLLDTHIAIWAIADAPRLHIPVDDAALMRVPQRRENLQRETNRVLLRDAAGLVNQLLERLPVHVFHRQIGYVADLARVDQIDDVRVAELSADLALAPGRRPSGAS